MNNKHRIRLGALALATTVTLGGAVGATLLLRSSTDDRLEDLAQPGTIRRSEPAEDGVCETHRCTHTVSPEGLTFTVHR